MAVFNVDASARAWFKVQAGSEAEARENAEAFLADMYAGRARPGRSSAAALVAVEMSLAPEPS